MVCKPLVADGVFYKPLVVCVDRRSQALGGRWRHLHAFGGIRGSSCARLLVAYMDRCVEAFGGLRESPFTSLWWHMEPFTSIWWYTWIVVYKPFGATYVVYKPLVADGVFYKPLVACVDRRSQALVGRWSRLQAFGCIRGSSCAKVLVAYMDRHVEAFGGIRGLSIASFWWLTWIAVHKPLVADGVVCKPLVAYVDYHV